MGGKNQRKLSVKYVTTLENRDATLGNNTHVGASEFIPTVLRLFCTFNNVNISLTVLLRRLTLLKQINVQQQTRKSPKTL